MSALAVQSAAETALLHRIAALDVSAVMELYDLMSPVVCGFVDCILSDQDESNTVVQEVFMRACEEAGSLDVERSAPVAWLARISQRLATERLRSMGEVGMSSQIETDASPNPADILMALAPEQRILIEHAYFKGYTQTELAQHFKLSMDQVRVRIWEGMSKLMKQSSRTVIPGAEIVRSQYLDMLAALDALGVLDGDDVEEYKRLTPNLTQEAQQDIAAFEQVAFRVLSGRAKTRVPPSTTRDHLQEKIRTLFDGKLNGNG